MRGLLEAERAAEEAEVRRLAAQAEARVLIRFSSDSSDSSDCGTSHRWLKRFYRHSSTATTKVRRVDSDEIRQVCLSLYLSLCACCSNTLTTSLVCSAHNVTEWCTNSSVRCAAPFSFCTKAIWNKRRRFFDLDTIGALGMGHAFLCVNRETVRWKRWARNPTISSRSPCAAQYALARCAACCWFTPVGALVYSDSPTHR